MANPKTYAERLKCFKNLHCPYCGGAATFEKAVSGKLRYVGLCITKGHMNNFTNKATIKRIVGVD